MHGLKSGSCRFWQRTDSPRGSNMHGLKSGSCRFWQRTDLPPGSNMLRRAAQTCSACKLAEVQIIPLPTLANQILARTFFRFRRTFVCVSSRWKVLSGEFRRRPTALAIKFHKSDRVGRRGLSEPREDFSRLNTYAFPWMCPWMCPWLCLWLFSSRIRLRAQPLKNSAGRVPQAADVTCNKIS